MKIQRTFSPADVFEDIRNGIAQYEAIILLGYDDIKKYYRRSRIGALWITLTTFIFVCGVGTFYSVVVANDIRNYFVNFTIAYVFWRSMDSALNNACTTYTKVAEVMLQRKTTLSEHALRQVTREGLLLLHIIPISVLIVLYFDDLPGMLGFFWIFVSILIFLYMSFWISVLLGISSVRWRDIPPLVATATSILFFLSPIIWSPAFISGLTKWVLYVNPAAALIELMRRSFLSEPLEPWIFYNLAFYSVLVSIAGASAIYMSKGRLAYWL